jgi:hypothetical protein
MIVILGVDYHPSFQQSAFVDAETGECSERTLMHMVEAESFYCKLTKRKEKTEHVGESKRPPVVNTELQANPFPSAMQLDRLSAESASPNHQQAPSSDSACWPNRLDTDPESPPRALVRRFAGRHKLPRRPSEKEQRIPFPWRECYRTFIISETSRA